MKADIVILNEEELIQINGADAGAVTIICDAAGAAAGAALGGPVGAAAGVVAGDLAADLIDNLSAINSALGPPGTFNPYSNPIYCEYGY